MDIQNKGEVYRSTGMLIYTAVLALACSPLSAAQPWLESQLLKPPIPPLANHELDRQRGGFINVEGFKVNIGLEKIVVVDGTMVARSSLVMPDLNVRETVNMAIDSGIQKLDAAMDNLDQTLAMAGIKAPSSTDKLKQAPALSSIVTDTATLSQLEYIEPVVADVAVEVERSHALPLAILSNGDSVTVMQDSINASTVIQNSVDSRLIQTLQVINIDLMKISAKTTDRVRSRLLPQIIHSIR